MATSMDFVKTRRRHVVTPDTSIPSRASRRPNQGVSLFAVAAIAIVGFFLLTRPAAADPKATVPAKQSTPAASTATDSRIGPPQPDSKSSLEQTVILDAPLPDSKTQQAPAAQAPVSTSAKPAASSDVSSFTVRILNGSGTAGLAAKLEASFKEKGFSVTSIGNATNGYPSSIIYYTASHKEAATSLQQATGNEKITLQENEVAKPADVLYVAGANEPVR